MSSFDDRFSMQLGDLTIEGRSRAGNETWVRVPQLGIALDAGRGPDPLIGSARLFISHVHPDHFAGVPFLASQRALQNLEAATIWLPEESREAAEELMRVHERLEGCSYPINLVGVSPGDRVVVKKNLEARAHRAPHRIPAIAWEFLDRRTRLRPQLRHLPGEVLAEMRTSGADIVEEHYVSQIFYSGDADADVFETAPAIFQSRIVLIESTYVMEEDRERAGRWGHLHLDEILERADLFSAEWIVLMHFTLRHRAREIHAQVARRCPAALRERIRLALPAPLDLIA